MWMRVCVVTVLLLLWATVVILGAPVWCGAVGTLAVVGTLLHARVSHKRHLHAAHAALKDVLAPARDSGAAPEEGRFHAVLQDIAAREPKRSAVLAQVPIYVTLGAAQSGKRSMLQQAGLTWAARELRGIAGANWWVANECAVLSINDPETARGALDALRRHRPHTPMNGFLVTLSVEDLVTLSEADLRKQAQALRDDLDTMQQILHSRAPVYLIVTKCDKVVGFAEAFQGLSRDARRRIWGRKFPRNAAKLAAALADLTTLFDAQVQSLAQENFALMSGETADRERIYQFPDQFATLRSPLLYWVNTFFGTIHRRAAPTLRGMFLCSSAAGVYAYDRLQEDRRMPVSATGRGPYFTQNIFPQGVLPDHAYRTAVTAENVPVLARQVSWAAAALLVAMPLVSYSENAWDLAASRAAVEGGIQQGAGALASLDSLDVLRMRVESLEGSASRASFMGVHSGMSQSAQLSGLMRTLYIRVLRDTVMAPLSAAEAAQLAEFAQSHANDFVGPTDREYKMNVDRLRLHLLVTGYYAADEHIFNAADASWLVTTLGSSWAHATGSENNPLARRRMEEHLGYFMQVREGRPDLLLPHDATTVTLARDIFARVDARTVLVEEALDGAQAYDLTLKQLLADDHAPLHSEGMVRGGYTRAGWENVVRGALQRPIVAHNTWVLGRSTAEALRAAAQAPATLEAEYWQRYVGEWSNFVNSVRPAAAQDKQSMAEMATVTQRLQDALVAHMTPVNLPTQLADQVNDVVTLRALRQQAFAPQPLAPREAHSEMTGVPAAPED